MPQLRGLDSGALAATAALGAVETRLPDDALTLLNGAATHSSRVPSLPNSRLSAAGLSLLEHFPLLGSGYWFTFIECPLDAVLNALLFLQVKFIQSAQPSEVGAVNTLFSLSSNLF